VHNPLEIAFFMQQVDKTAFSLLLRKGNLIKLEQISTKRKEQEMEYVLVAPLSG